MRRRQFITLVGAAAAWPLFDRLPELAVDIVRRKVAVITTPGSTPAALAAKAATMTIPIVFSIGADPVQAGLVASLNRPGGNVTGISSMNLELGAKRLGLVHELVPGAARFAVLVDPNSPATETMIKDVQAAASAIGRQIEVLTATTSGEIDAAFASLWRSGQRTRAYSRLLVQQPSRTTGHVGGAPAVPTIYSSREFAEAGGLMSYGPSVMEEFRQAGI